MINAREELALLISSRNTMAAVDAILAAGYGKLADAWDEGSQAGWSDRTRSIMGRYTHEQEIANETPNPYRSAAK